MTVRPLYTLCSVCVRMAGSSRRSVIPETEIGQFFTNCDSEIEDISDSESESLVLENIRVNSELEADDKTVLPQPSSSKTRLVKRKKVVTKTSIEYYWRHDPHFFPAIYDFIEHSCGINPNQNINENSPELEYFELFFDTSLVQYIVDQTNVMFFNKYYLYVYLLINFYF